MIDDHTRTAGERAESAERPNDPAASRAGFCQECGQALTPATLRRVGNGVFCGICAVQGGTGAAWRSVNPGTYNGSYNGAGVPGGPTVRAAGEPNPVLAGMLGLIPGVGAMFNGQAGKGALHLIVFVVLVMLADNLNWALWWLVWGWIFYQAFDAYHTARARRDGLPLPNPFGWNDVGERLGFNRSAAPEPAPGTPPSAGNQTPYTGANWAGYVPPTGPASTTQYTAYEPFWNQPRENTPVDPQKDIRNDNPYTAPFAQATAAPPPPVPPHAPPYSPSATSMPYVPTYTGGVPAQAVAPPGVIYGARRFPVGAMWLIGLGTLFLIGNLLPEWRLSGRWLVPVLLAALAAWTGSRRWEQARAVSSTTGVPPNVAATLSGPAMLFTVAVLLGFQAGHVVRLHRSWPVLLVVWGGMLLAQRTAQSSLPDLPAALPEALPPSVRSTSGTGSLGL